MIETKYAVAGAMLIGAKEFMDLHDSLPYSSKELYHLCVLGAPEDYIRTAASCGLSWGEAGFLWEVAHRKSAKEIMDSLGGE